ncbi:hypothetical protein D3C75_617430 [compost metagenome]
MDSIRLDHISVIGDGQHTVLVHRAAHRHQCAEYFTCRRSRSHVDDRRHHRGGGRNNTHHCGWDAFAAGIAGRYYKIIGFAVFKTGHHRLVNRTADGLHLCKRTVCTGAFLHCIGGCRGQLCPGDQRTLVVGLGDHVFRGNRLPFIGIESNCSVGHHDFEVLKGSGQGRACVARGHH